MVGKRRVIGIAAGFAIIVIAGSLVVPLREHLEMPASAYKSWVDRTIVGTGYTIRGRPPPCLVAGGGYWDGSIEDISDVKPWEECLRFTEPKRWTGLWETGWEWSNFCPDPAKECDWMTKRGIQLRFSEGAFPTNLELLDGIHRIEFVGRRTQFPGKFGHGGSYDHVMVVDRLLAVKPIPGEKYTER